MVIFRCFLYVYQRVMELVDAKPHHCASGLWSSKKNPKPQKISTKSHQTTHQTTTFSEAKSLYMSIFVRDISDIPV